MQTKRGRAYDCLSPYTRESGTGGPTSTFTVQKTFAQRLRGVLSRINAAIRKGVIQNDVFGIQTDTLAVDDLPDFETDTSPQMTAKFLAWLRKQLDTEFLSVVGPDRNEFIKTAYVTGLRNANSQLRDLDISFELVAANELVERPIHVSALQELYSRCYQNLVSVTDDLVDDVRDTLLEGFREGLGPREIGINLTNRVDSIGKNRATMIARSEIINAHSESTLTRIDETQEEADGTLTTTHSSWDAANDSRTCPLCRALDGVRLETSEMRGGVVNVIAELPGEISQVGQTFRLAPPAHPNCRCNVSVRVGSEITTPLEERLPDEIRVVPQR